MLLVVGPSGLVLGDRRCKDDANGGVGSVATARRACAAKLSGIDSSRCFLNESSRYWSIKHSIYEVIIEESQILDMSWLKIIKDSST